MSAMLLRRARPGVFTTNKWTKVIRAMGIKSMSHFQTESSPNKEFIVFDCMSSGFNTHFVITINEPAEHLSIRSQPKWKMPRDKLSTTLLYVTLLNYKMVMGTVDLDTNDGEVQYKTTGTFGASRNIKPIVKKFMNYHVKFGTRYLEGFAAIKDRGASAEDAIEIAGQSVSDARTSDAAEIILRMLLLSMSS